MVFEGCCAHDHDCEAEECSGSWSLHKHIDIHKVRCLNEAEEGTCRRVFKPWERRLDPDGATLRSNDDDPELLVYVPFDGAVKLRALSVIGGPGGSSPAKMRVFVNRDNLDFAAVAELQPTQEWDLLENLNGLMEYPTQVTKFNGVHSIALHFPANFGAEATEISFVGFKGEFTERRREAVTAVYETRPVPADHKALGWAGPPSFELSDCFATNLGGDRARGMQGGGGCIEQGGLKVAAASRDKECPAGKAHDERLIMQCAFGRGASALAQFLWG